MLILLILKVMLEVLFLLHNLLNGTLGVLYRKLIILSMIHSFRQKNASKLSLLAQCMVLIIYQIHLVNFTKLIELILLIICLFFIPGNQNKYTFRICLVILKILFLILLINQPLNMLNLFFIQKLTQKVNFRLFFQLKFTDFRKNSLMKVNILLNFFINPKYHFLIIIQF